MSDLRELAKTFREAADVLDEMTNIEENEALDKKEKEEAQEELLAKLMIKMLKINKLQM